MKNLLNYIFLLGISSLFFACQDVVNVDLKPGESQLAVDAWITDQPGNQSIRLTITQGYFDNNPAPPALGATVSISDNTGKNYTFNDLNNDGNYIWQATPADSILGKLGNQYTLTITYQGETFEATSEVRRVPPIDSITYEFRKEQLGNPKGQYAELFARDFPGTGDTYWVRTYKNGKFLNHSTDINIAYDAGFSKGGNIDGLTFITPIREGINPLYQNKDDKNKLDPPYAVGDTIRVEIYSITEDAFDFLSEVQTQLNNSGLFAVPISNVSTNLINKNPNSKVKAVGFFGASAVSMKQGMIGENKGSIK